MLIIFSCKCNSFYWSSLENYTSNNTTQHDTTRVQHKTTRHSTSTTRLKHDTTRGNTNTTQGSTSTARDNTSTIRHNTSTTRPNTSTGEALAAKIGLHFALFVTELYIFSYNTSFWNTKQPRTYDILRKVKRPTVYKT